MSEAYERERQNNARLEELSAKVSSLRGVTVDIYDNARAQDVIDNTVSLSCRFPLLSLLSFALKRGHSLINMLERHILLHVDTAQGLREPPGPDGRRREQGRRAQAFGDRHRRVPGAVLPRQMDLLSWGQRSAERNPTSTRYERKHEAVFIIHLPIRIMTVSHP